MFRVFLLNKRNNYPNMEAQLPEIDSLWDTRIHNLRLCFDRSECSDTCDFHPGIRQYLKNVQIKKGWFSHSHIQLYLNDRLGLMVILTKPITLVCFSSLWLNKGWFKPGLCILFLLYFPEIIIFSLLRKQKTPLHTPVFSDCSYAANTASFTWVHLARLGRPELICVLMLTAIADMKPVKEKISWVH